MNKIDKAIKDYEKWLSQKPGEFDEYVFDKYNSGYSTHHEMSIEFCPSRKVFTISLKDEDDSYCMSFNISSAKNLLKYLQDMICQK